LLRGYQATDRVGYLRVKELRCYNRTEEVEDGREGDSDARRQGSRSYRRRDGVRRIVEAVGEVASATAMVSTSRKVCVSGILHHDALEHVRHLLAAVEGVLEEHVQVFQLNDLERWELTAEEFCDGVTRG
jgi:hypothetical protein